MPFRRWSPRPAPPWGRPVPSSRTAGRPPRGARPRADDPLPAARGDGLRWKVDQRAPAPEDVAGPCGHAPPDVRVVRGFWYGAAATGRVGIAALIWHLKRAGERGRGLF